MHKVSVGDHVLYVAHECHHMDAAPVHGPLFHFKYAEGAHKHLRGQRAAEAEAFNFQQPGWGVQRTPGGLLFAANQQPIVPDGPKFGWPATVVRVNADGTLDLDIRHPHGGITLHYPDRDAHPDAAGIRHDPTGKTPHTYHLPED